MPRWHKRQEKLKRFKKSALAVWEVIAVLAVIGIVALFFVEISMDLTERQHYYFLAADIFLLCLLALDLAIIFVRAESKKKFFKENWWLILALTPFTWFLRPLRLVRFTRVVRFFRLENYVERIRKAIHSVAHSSRAAPKIAQGARAVGRAASKSPRLARTIPKLKTKLDERKAKRSAKKASRKARKQERKEARKQVKKAARKLA